MSAPEPVSDDERNDPRGLAAGIGVHPSMGNAPLAGIRVVVTRPPKQAARFAERLALVGGEAIVCPALVIEPPENPSALRETLAQLERYDYAVFVSANAADAVLVALEREGRRWPASLVAIGVGPTTFDALVGGRLERVVVPPERWDSEGVLALPELAEVRGKRIVLFRGERGNADPIGTGDVDANMPSGRRHDAHARSDRRAGDAPASGSGRELMRETLVARGALVDAVACYRRLRPTFDASGLVERWRAGGVDAVVATSGEVLDNFIALIGAAGRPLLAETPLFVPHERIAAHARNAGLSNVVTTAATDSGLLAGLLAFFPPRSDTRTP